MRLAILVALLLVGPVSAHADRDTTAVGSETPRGLLHIEMAKEGTKDATFVQPRADGMVGYLTPDNTMEYVAMYRVRRIMDAKGLDVTSRALRRREWLGVAPAGPTRKSHGWKSLRLRAGPSSVCHSYMITDFTALRSEGPRTGIVYGASDLGYARNVGGNHALGASAFLGALGVQGSDRVQLGLRLHLVQWIGARISADLAPGVLLAENTYSSHLKAPGLCSQASVSLDGRFGLVGQMVSASRRVRDQYIFDLYPSPYRDEHGTSWYMGIRFGAEPGIMGSAAFLVGEAITHMSSRVFAPIP